MSDDGFKVQITLNAPPPAQYAKGAMANFRGDTVDEVASQLARAREAGLLELAAEVESIWTAASGVGARTETVQQAPQNNVVNLPQQAQPAAGGRVCPVHAAPMTYKSGVSQRTGNSYAMWLCTVDKNCKQWVGGNS